MSMKYKGVYLLIISQRSKFGYGLNNFRKDNQSRCILEKVRGPLWNGRGSPDFKMMK